MSARLDSMQPGQRFRLLSLRGELVKLYAGSALVRVERGALKVRETWSLGTEVEPEAAAKGRGTR